MNQNPYLPLVSLGQSFGNYFGGACQWWYTPIENLDGFPDLDPANQQLKNEPALKAGKTWYGPVNVPNNEIGFYQASARVTAGKYFKRKMVGFIPGFDSYTYIAVDNTLDHQLCVVAKMRSGGFFVVFGDDQAGLDLDIAEETGVGASGTPGTKLTLTDECPDKAFIIPSFLGTNSQPPFTIPSNIMANLFEEIPWNTSGDTTINWTLLRQTNFGMYPSFELWEKQGDGSYSKANIPIVTVGSPITAYVVQNNGGEGFIKLS